MNTKLVVLAAVLCLLTLLWGCRQTTTVILPPDTPDPTTEGAVLATPPTEAPTDSATTVSPVIEPTSPTAAPETEPLPVSDPEPSTEPTREPTAAPETEPAYDPTEPPAIPVTEPATEPEPAKHPVYDISSHSIGSLEYALLDSINSKRAEQDLAHLSLDGTLCALARIRAYECTGSFSHSRPDGRGAFSVLSDYGYNTWSNLNERIHYGTAGLSAGTLVKGWMYTDDFSASILSGDFTHIGIGVYDHGGLTYIVCFFAG